MTTLYPRLAAHEGRLLLQQYDGLGLNDIRVQSDVSHPNGSYAATGGIPASAAHLSALATLVRQCADEFGYPRPSENRTRTSADRALAALMHQSMDIVPAEAAEPDVWTFLACRLLPDVVMWRWGTSNEERWIGQGLVRHAFGRLWWQAHVLVTERDGTRDYSLVEHLAEADLNQIFERRTIGGVPPLARALAHELSAPRLGQVPVARRRIVRDVTKRVRRLLPYTSFLALDESEIRQRVAELVDVSARELVREEAAAL